MAPLLALVGKVASCAFGSGSLRWCAPRLDGAVGNKTICLSHVRLRMTKLRGITIGLFACAMLCYAMVGSVIGGLFAIVGVLLELAGWASLFSDHKRGESQEKKVDGSIDKHS